MINNKWLLILLLFFSFISIHAKSAKELFMKMPADFTPLLTEVNKADFIDFLESKMKAEITNRLEGKSEMTQLTDDYIHIQMTSNSEWEMKVFSLAEGDYLIGLITTACGPVCDSQIQFYDSNWKELPLDDYLVLPDFSKTIQWPTDEVDKVKLQRAIQTITFTLYQASFEVEQPAILFKCNTLDYLDTESSEKIKQYIQKEFSFLWNGYRFE
ncbi:MAG: DUF3256 family protein [Bacteroides sp.]|nr:DUF3256 family protein [Bacteroides sp.]MDD2645822.1 DUF3256 family protein [Bacteroides sp.]MDD4055893.1 DUF3256 family protein [Bacteroides sp.]MDD4719838.1 DUF3256 family protein [Bacteroides sp.]NLI64397.1 DUF3256 family protein [Bacteroidales bacterium]